MICLLTLLIFATNTNPINTARLALEDGLPGVAIQKLANLPADQRDAESDLLLACAYIQNRQPTQAIDILNKSSIAGQAFWLAQALTALDRKEEALANYRAAKNDPVFSVEAILGEARILRSLGCPDEAIHVLKKASPFPHHTSQIFAQFEEIEARLDLQQAEQAQEMLEKMAPENKADAARRDFLIARALAMRGDDIGAIERFNSLTPLDPHMAISATIGQAEALIRTRQNPAAEALLEKFLSQNSDLDGSEVLFAILDKIYTEQPSPTSTELKRWAHDETPSKRRQLATFYLAKFEERAGRNDRAEKLLERAVENHSPETNMAALDLAKIRLKQGRTTDALTLLQSLSNAPEAEFLRGLTLAGLNKYDAASQAFLSAASSEILAESALFNASVCELGSQKQEASELLKKRFPDSQKIDLLKLQEALVLAQADNPQAADLLNQLTSSKNLEISHAAILALAEWKFKKNDKIGSQNELKRIPTSGNADTAHADALAVFLADDGSSGTQAIQAAEKFLAQHAGSLPEPEVRMKWGEILYRKGDFAGARIQLEALARKYTGSPQEIPALFLAAQSASRLQTQESTNDALLFYEEVAASNTPLALRARLEQAILKNILGKPRESIAILDRILASNPDPEIKAAALIEKGKILLEPMTLDAKKEAIDVWTSLAADHSFSTTWRNQALVRIGAAHERFREEEAAIATYYEVLESGRSGPPEYFWFYQAGFGAARLLESGKHWDQAIKVYELIATANGPRSEEAAARIHKIRLENFLWEEKSPQ